MDIIAAAQRALDYTENLDSAGFGHDSRSVEAVMFDFVIIGEAARNVPPEVEARHPEVPWQDMRRMRNFVAHAYFGADTRILFETVRRDLPPLVAQLRLLLESEVP